MTHETPEFLTRVVTSHPSSEELEAQQILELPARRALSLIPSDLTTLLADPSFLGGGAAGASPLPAGTAQPATSPAATASLPLVSKLDPSKLSIL